MLTTHYEEMRRFISRIPEVQLATRIEGGWTVAQAAGHIAEAPATDIFVAGRLCRGKNATVPRALAFVIDLRNRLKSRRYTRVHRADLLGELEKHYNAMFAFVNELEDNELDASGEVFGRGRISAYEFIIGSPEHARGHAHDIETALGLPAPAIVEA